MQHALPNLPYELDALEPHMSSETLTYHHGHHHAAYVRNLNKLIIGTEFEHMSLTEIVESAPAGAVFNNAAQAWNHEFFWHCMSPDGGGRPRGKLMKALEKSFGSFCSFEKRFSEQALAFFGCGWLWLARGLDGTVFLKSTSNADTPLISGQAPLLTCDLWEHAYYIDYRCQRARYIEAFWKLVNWRFVAENLAL